MKRLVLLGACAFLLAACGGGGSLATDEIKAAYTGFFTTKTSLARHVALMENGAKFKPVIQSFLGSPLASGISASVSSVTLQGADTAKVVYSVKVPGFSLSDQTGYAVRQGGRWRVAYSTLCGLVGLGGKPPTACNA